jgi:hypothetical protein
VAEGATEGGKVTYVPSRNMNADCFEEREAIIAPLDILLKKYNNNLTIK